MHTKNFQHNWDMKLPNALKALFRLQILRDLLAKVVMLGQTNIPNHGTWLRGVGDSHHQTNINNVTVPPKWLS